MSHSDHWGNPRLAELDDNGNAELIERLKLAEHALETGSTAALPAENLRALLSEARQALAVQSNLAGGEEILTDSNFRAAYGMNEIGKVEIDPHSNMILAANRFFAKITGYEPAELLGMRISDLTYVDDLAKDAIYYQQAAAGERDEWICEKRYVRKDGSLIWVNLLAAIVRGPEGGPARVYGIVQDIHAARLMQEEKQRQQDLLERIVEEAPTGIAFLSGPLHRYTLVNRAFQVISRGKGSLIGRTVAEVWPEIAGEIVPLLDQVYATGQPYRSKDQPYDLRRDSGVETNYFDFTFLPMHSANNQVEGVLVLSIENTEQVRSRQELEEELAERIRAQRAGQESERRFRQLADAMPQLVWTALPDGTVDYYNRRSQEYSGIVDMGASGWQWGPVLHEEDVLLTQKAWSRSVQTGEIYQIEHRVHMADGSVRWHLSRGIPARDSQGQVIKWYGTATDIHETKLIEEALRESQEKLTLYAHRLEASNRDLEDFAFIASHDLQEPLRKIARFGELVRHNTAELDDTSLDYLARMMNAAQRMQLMIEHLLEYSRLNTRAQPFTEVNLNEVAAEVLVDLESVIESNHAAVEIGPLPTIQAEPMQMRQLFLNLLGNALKFHDKDSAPSIQVTSRAGPEDWMVSLAFKDNGIGLDEAETDRIFQPFQRLHGRSEYEGSGIGLAICRKIVERHQGIISVSSRPGEGATFTVVLPARQDEEADLLRAFG